MKKMIVILILMVMLGWDGVVLGASYPTGQATVRTLTPFNGIPKYSGLGQQYVNEWSAARWGVATTAGELAVNAGIGLIESGTLKTAAKTTSLIVSRANCASMVAVALQSGLLVGTYFLNDWLQEMDWTLDEQTGVVMKDDPASSPYYRPSSQAQGVGQVASGCFAPYQGGPTNRKSEGNTFCESSTACTSAAQAYASSKGGTYMAWGNFETWFTNWNTTYWGGGQVMYAVPGGNGCGGTYAYKGFTGPKTGYWQMVEYVEGGKIPVTEADMEDGWQDSHEGESQNAEAMRQSAFAALAPYVNESNKNWPVDRISPGGAPAGSPQLTQAQQNKIQQAIDDSITSDDNATLQNPGAGQVGDGDWEYTPEQMAQAQYEKDKQLDGEQKADYESYGVEALGAPEEPSPPEKQSITETLEGFIEGQETSGILSILDSAKEINSSGGVCSMGVDLGDWGTLEFSFCEWETQLNAFGNMLVMLCSLGWLLWFFMGRGDA